MTKVIPQHPPRTRPRLFACGYRRGRVTVARVDGATVTVIGASARVAS
jgi:hypothetical protein